MVEKDEYHTIQNNRFWVPNDWTERSTNDSRNVGSESNVTRVPSKDTLGIPSEFL
jgi:hypothetical protein